MQTEMGGRYFPTLTTSRSNNRNITQVLLVLTESHCANTQGGMKCQGWNANGWSLTLYRGGRDAMWSRWLCKTCVCVVYYHTVCHHISISTFSDATLCWWAMPNALKVCFILHSVILFYIWCHIYIWYSSSASTLLVTYIWVIMQPRKVPSGLVSFCVPAPGRILLLLADWESLLRCINFWHQETS